MLPPGIRWNTMLHGCLRGQKSEHNKHNVQRELSWVVAMARAIGASYVPHPLPCGVAFLAGFFSPPSVSSGGAGVGAAEAKSSADGFAVATHVACHGSSAERSVAPVMAIAAPRVPCASLRPVPGDHADTTAADAPKTKPISFMRTRRATSFLNASRN
jgi:hypothetical protein